MHGSTRAWRRDRSSHARVLEALEASIAAHPASGRREQGRPGTGRLARNAERATLRLVQPVDAPDPPDAA